MIPSTRASQDASITFGDTPMVVQVCDPLECSASTLTTAAVSAAPGPVGPSSTRTLKSVRCMRSSAGQRPLSALRRASSSALTGPLPSPTAAMRSSPTHTLIVASVERSTPAVGDTSPSR